MSHKHKKKAPPWVLIAVTVAFVGGGVYIVKNVLSEDSPRKKTPVATVTLLKPPPPIMIKEKPPELQPPKETQKKEEIIDPLENQAQTPQNSDSRDNTPAGDNLGVDAEGGAGGDSFGLVGKKGGRSILSGGGGFGKISLLNKYAGYAQVVQTEVKKKVMKRLNEEGGIPKGKLQAVIRVTVDNEGAIETYRIIGSSGNNRMDDAVKEALQHLKISEPPPDGMPRTMDIKISSQG